MLLLLAFQKFVCRVEYGVLHGVTHARLVEKAGDKGSQPISRIAVHHAGGVHFLTETSDNLYPSAKLSIVEAINAHAKRGQAAAPPTGMPIMPNATPAAKPASASALGRALQPAPEHESDASIASTLNPMIMPVVPYPAGNPAHGLGMPPGQAPYNATMAPGYGMVPPQQQLQPSMYYGQPPGPAGGPPVQPQGPPAAAPPAAGAAASWFGPALAGTLEGVRAAPEEKSLLQAMEGLKRLIHAAPPAELTPGAHKQIVAVCTEKRLNMGETIWQPE